MDADSTLGTRRNLAQIERLRREPPSEAELARVKQLVIGRASMKCVMRSGIVSQLEYVNEHGLGEVRGSAAMRLGDGHERRGCPARTLILILSA